MVCSYSCASKSNYTRLPLYTVSSRTKTSTNVVSDLPYPSLPSLYGWLPLSQYKWLYVHGKTRFSSHQYPRKGCKAFSQVRELAHPSRVLEKLMQLIVRLAKSGLIHGDFNEFNLMIDDSEHITVIGKLLYSLRR